MSVPISVSPLKDLIVRSIGAGFNSEVVIVRGNDPKPLGYDGGITFVAVRAGIREE